MKRLLCIVSSLDTGGAETFIMKLFRHLPKDYKLDFIVSATGGFYEDEVKQLGGRVYEIPLRTEHPVKTFFSIKKVVQDNHYETILKLCDTPIGVYDLLAAKLGGAKKLCVRSCNASANIGKLSIFINNLIRPLFNHLAKVKFAPSLVAAEYTFGKKAVKKGETFILHNAVDLDVYNYNPETRDVYRKELDVSDDELLLGHIGRFSYQKNHKFLVDIFSGVIEHGINAKLVLVGTGELFDDIKKYAEDLHVANRILFLGVRSDVPQLLSAFDLFVFPSWYEGMPNTVIEAEATGLPCFLSDRITRDADITGLLNYLSIDDKNVWVESICEYQPYRKIDIKPDFIKEGYVIDNSVKNFIDLVF